MTKRFGFRLILSICMLLEVLVLAAAITLEAATGGKIKPEGQHIYGKYSSYILIIFYCNGGLNGGAILTIQKLAPRRLIGPNASKLQFLSGAVMTCYEVAAMAGSLCLALLFLPRIGANFPIVSLVSASIAGTSWFLLRTSSEPKETEEEKPGRAFQETKQSAGSGKIQQPVISRRLFALPFISIWQGAKTLGHRRDTFWLILAYPLTQYGHAFLEHTIAPVLARHYLQDPNVLPILVAGSNIGELLGAVAAMFFQRYVSTPMLWLRLNAMMLLLAWFFPFWELATDFRPAAWHVALILMPMGAAWSAALVSLVSHLQKTVSDKPSEATSKLSPLSCSLGCLFAIEITLLGSTGILFGQLIDRITTQDDVTESDMVKDIRHLFRWIVGVNFSVVAAIILGSTFIPRGSLKFNPKRITSLEENYEVEENKTEPERIEG